MQICKLLYSTEYFEIPFLADSCRGQIGSNMRDRNFSGSCLDDQWSLNTCLGHNDVIAFLPLDCEPFNLKYADQLLMMNRSDF